jgi:hypothetical protein
VRHSHPPAVAGSASHSPFTFFATCGNHPTFTIHFLYNLRESPHVHLSLSLQPGGITPFTFHFFHTLRESPITSRGVGGRGDSTVPVEACNKAGTFDTYQRNSSQTTRTLMPRSHPGSVTEAHKCTKAETPLCFTGSLKSLARRNVDPQR